MRCTRRYRKSLHSIGLLFFSYFFYELYILQFTSVLHRRCFFPPKNCSRGALTDLTCYDLDVWTVFLSAETRAADFCSFYNVIVHWEVIWNIAQCASETQTNNPEKCYFFLRLKFIQSSCRCFVRLYYTVCFGWRKYFLLFYYSLYVSLPSKQTDLGPAHPGPQHYVLLAIRQFKAI